jgi:hypothetical protein
LGDNSPFGDGVYTGNNVCELAMFGFINNRGKRVRVIYAYNHPKSSMSMFYQKLKEFMRAHYLASESGEPVKSKDDTIIYLIGDMNCDLKKLSPTMKSKLGKRSSLCHD